MRARKCSWYHVSVLQEISIGSISDITLLYLVFYFRCLLQHYKLKIYRPILNIKFNQPKWPVTALHATAEKTGPQKKEEYAVF